MKELKEMSEVVKELSEILTNPPKDLHWSFFAELLCDIETLLFCVEIQSPNTFRAVGESFSKKAVMLLTLKDSELVGAIAKSMIVEECAKIVHTICEVERSKNMYS